MAGVVVVDIEDLRRLLRELVEELKQEFSRPIYLHTNEACKLLDCSEPTLRKLARAGKIRRLTGARGFRYDRVELERYLAEG